MATPTHVCRAAIARAVRAGDKTAEVYWRRENAAAQIREKIESVVDSAPPLSPAQVAELQALLGGAA